jgi:hypothetical protein
MKSSLSKIWPHPLHSLDEHRDWMAALHRFVEIALREPIRKHPIKFVALSAWTAFFAGLIIHG